MGDFFVKKFGEGQKDDLPYHDPSPVGPEGRGQTCHTTACEAVPPPDLGGWASEAQGVLHDAGYPLLCHHGVLLCGSRLDSGPPQGIHGWNPMPSATNKPETFELDSPVDK